MTDKTDLIDKIAWYLDRYCDGPTPRERHAEAIKQLCIESDDAREYWVKYFRIDPNMTILGSAHEADIREDERKLLVEQACDAVVNASRDHVYNSEQWIIKAIRDKFK